MSDEVVISENSGTESVHIRKELKNGLTKTMEVRKIENGYIIKKNIYGSLKSSGDKEGRYVDETTEYYSETNPIKSEEEKAEVEMSGLLNSIKNM